MSAATAGELDGVLYLYHEISAEIVDRKHDLDQQVENSLGFAIPYSRQHPEAAEEQIAREVVRRWSIVSKDLEVPIPFDVLSKKFQQS